MRDDREMACANKQVGQQGAQRKMNKVHYFMINPRLKEILSVAAELSGHKKGINSKRQRTGIHPVLCSDFRLSIKRWTPIYIEKQQGKKL